MIQRIGLLCIFVLLVIGIWLPLPAPTAAQVLPPRPTLTPTPVESERPRERRTAIPDSRITGTVIDLTTGAPVAGVAVQVGDVTVLSDANGNYDRSGIPAGSYIVALILAPEQGIAAQEPLRLELAAATTIVQHLAFRSPLPPTPLPLEPSPVPVIAEAPPATLPATAAPWRAGPVLLVIGIALLVFGVVARRRL